VCPSVCDVVELVRPHSLYVHDIRASQGVQQQFATNLGIRNSNHGSRHASLPLVCGYAVQVASGKLSCRWSLISFPFPSNCYQTFSLWIPNKTPAFNELLLCRRDNSNALCADEVIHSLLEKELHCSLVVMFAGGRDPQYEDDLTKLPDHHSFVLDPFQRSVGLDTSSHQTTCQC